MMTVSILTVLSLLHMIDPKEVSSENYKVKTASNNQTRYRLFLDELYLLQDNANVNFKDTLKAHIPWTKFENNLDIKRKSYDISFVNLLEKYDICPNDLYSELDRLWDKAKEKDRKAFMDFASTTVPPGIASNSAMHQGWDRYIQGTKQIAQQLAKDQLYKSIQK